MQLKYERPKKIAIGSTKAGLTLKENIKKYLTEKGYEVDDLGMKRKGRFIPYYEAARRVASAVSAGEYKKAIIICGTGAGSAIVANKFKGVYAVQASSEYEGRQAKIINNANVLTLGEWITPPQHAIKIVEAWLNSKFTEGFESDWKKFLKDAYQKIRNIESENLKK